jgi:hypothetical protein
VNSLPIIQIVVFVVPALVVIIVIMLGVAERRRRSTVAQMAEAMRGKLDSTVAERNFKQRNENPIRLKTPKGPQS